MKSNGAPVIRTRLVTARHRQTELQHALQIERSRQLSWYKRWWVSRSFLGLFGVYIGDDGKLKWPWKIVASMIGVSTIVLVFGFWKLYVLYRDTNRKKKFDANRQNDTYDVCIVGSGPAGSSCAYYLARSGLRVLLLEKSRFPRDQICGDLVSLPAQQILEEMGVLQNILNEGAGKWIVTCGMVGPGGRSFVGEIPYNQDLIIQRIVLDERMANAAVTVGAHLLEEREAESVQYIPEAGHWKINCAVYSSLMDQGSQKASNVVVTYKARALVAADGSNSLIARSLGLVKTPPNTLFSRSFAKPGTHNFKADSMLFCPKKLLPGFFVISRELEDYLSISCFTMPNGRVAPENLQTAYEDLIKNDPYIKQMLGPNIVLTPFQTAPMRVGGVSKAYSDAFLVIGDAAGQIDPLTGCGIQYGMQAAKSAAETLIEAFNRGDLSSNSMRDYQKKIDRLFWWDFLISKYVQEIVDEYPTTLDGAIAVIKRNGEEFIQAWLMARAGQRSKMWFLRADVLTLILSEALVQWLWWKIRDFVRAVRSPNTQTTIVDPPK